MLLRRANAITMHAKQILQHILRKNVVEVYLEDAQMVWARWMSSWTELSQ